MAQKVTSADERIKDLEKELEKAKEEEAKRISQSDGTPDAVCGAIIIIIIIIVVVVVVVVRRHRLFFRLLNRVSAGTVGLVSEDGCHSFCSLHPSVSPSHLSFLSNSFSLALGLVS